VLRLPVPPLTEIARVVLRYYPQTFAYSRTPTIRTNIGMTSESANVDSVDSGGSGPGSIGTEIKVVLTARCNPDLGEDHHFVTSLGAEYTLVCAC
jgi:hypothetical protein